jgi:rubredoxin
MGNYNTTRNSNPAENWAREGRKGGMMFFLPVRFICRYCDFIAKSLKSLYILEDI